MGKIILSQVCVHRSYEDVKLTVASVHKDLVPFIKRRKLVLAPSISTLNKAFDMMEHNMKADLASDRQRFEVSTQPSRWSRSS